MDETPESNTFIGQDGVQKYSRLFVALIPVAFILGLGLGYILWGQNAAKAVAVQANVQTETPGGNQQVAAQKIKRYDVPVDDDPSIGPANAPITIIEFSDYECPYCQRFQQEVFPKILQTFPTQVRLVYRDFPLSTHPDAEPSAEAANCANEQGAYWKYHDKLFSGQYGLGTDAYLKYASDLGLDTTAFTKCLEDHRYQKEVQADFQYAAALGVNSTPTFFLNGLPIVGAQPFEVFQEVINKELAGEIPK
jgi:protein-disulfide isomerase